MTTLLCRRPLVAAAGFVFVFHVLHLGFYVQSIWRNKDGDDDLNTMMMISGGKLWTMENKHKGNESKYRPRPIELQYEGSLVLLYHLSLLTTEDDLSGCKFYHQMPALAGQNNQ